jgi:hypothetical protein
MPVSLVFVMAQLKFVGRISTQGSNLIVWIPKEFHKDAKPLKGKQVKILIDDNI